MRRTYLIINLKENTIKSFYIILISLLIILLSKSVHPQSEPIGPGNGSFDGNYIFGQFLNWDRNATPKLVLRLQGAGILQTFSDISASGEFKLPLREVPDDQNYGTKGCGDFSKGPILVAADISLLTTLKGFSSPGKWDNGLSEIGMAVFSDEKFSKNISKPGGRRAYWLYSKVKRIVEAGECNNSNAFPIEKGWNAFTLVSGPGGGPHIYNPGLDDDLGWYWYAFPEDLNQGVSPETKTNAKIDENTDETGSVESEIESDWLVGEWNGVQVDVRIQMRLQSSGNVWLESIENGHKKTMEGKWSLTKGEFLLNIKEGEMQFNIQQTSETSFRLYGKDASSDIVFVRKE